MDLLTQITQALTGATGTVNDLETEVRNAKLYGVASLVLLVYIAMQVRKR